ncbi:hypothetical protein Dimus_032996 [Dionaea muscipula]
MENGGNGGGVNSCTSINEMMMMMMMGYGGGAAIMSSSTSSSYFPPPPPPPPLPPHQNLTSSSFSPAACGGEEHNQHRATSNSGCSVGGSSFSSTNFIKAKIIAHPHYPRLLAAYVNCKKMGAPPEVVARLEEACAAETEAAMMGRTTTGAATSSAAGYLGEDPALDQFMEAYCEMLTHYERELSKPINEAMVFLSRIELQFKALTLSSSSSSTGVADSAYGEGSVDRNVLSEDEIDVNMNLIDPQVEDRELKCQLLRKYSGYLGSLKQEFMKKRKKGKLPKEARRQLLDWWTRHYKWPYPSESQKVALAESTGLDQKQISNWFINQRKRHWKPSEDMQLVVMDAANFHYNNYMDNVIGNPYPMDIFSE